ncbi:MAG: hypothetical protein KKE79_02180 [Actinobacteria bacterium]|nr:hypothetical protein [Actinomycetota bacterium]MBU4302126.1 hypothetical protein [Actinomycetota bacterium]MBU4489423.1 hypothetical protein [Actinomycetota bacterium]MCG2794658.1 hypothetical protein [Actinomycetes bacterium]
MLSCAAAGQCLELASRSSARIRIPIINTVMAMRITHALTVRRWISSWSGLASSTRAGGGPSSRIGRMASERCRGASHSGQNSLLLLTIDPHWGHSMTTYRW